METAIEYIERTESAVRHLIAGIGDYLNILKPNQGAVFSGSFSSGEERSAALEKWMQENEEAIQKDLTSQRQFTSEKYALATLCGALLQVSAAAIRIYSDNDEIPTGFADAIKPGSAAARYCIGREVRSVPLGLVIYAGRNQYNHIDEGELHGPNVAVFERLATCHNYGEGIRDPALDLEKQLAWYYPSNITSIMGWRSYDAYVTDMKELLC